MAVTEAVNDLGKLSPTNGQKKPTPETSGVFLPRKTEWVIGVDLGQSTDPTAIAVLEHTTGVLDFNSEFERHTNTGSIPQKSVSRIDVRHLQRLPLGLSYPTIIEAIAEIMARAPLNESQPTLVVDDTGVGKAVSDLMVERGMKPMRVTITAGSEVTQHGLDRWHVPKGVLISVTDALLHTGELRFAAALTEAEAMKNELKDFRRKLSEAGRATYAARTGTHDDLVLAVAIGVWWIEKPKPKPAVFGTWHRSTWANPSEYHY